MLNQTLITEDGIDGYKPTMRTDSDDLTKDKNMPQTFWRLNWKTFTGAIMMIAMITLLILIIVLDDKIEHYFRHFLQWVQHNVSIGALACIALYWICTVLMVPGSLFGLGAGFVFHRALDSQWLGIFVATIIVFIGASAGSMTAYSLSRFLLRDRVLLYIIKHETFDIIDQVIEENGMKVALLLRLSPIIPFNILNYFMGITSVTFKSYTLALFGILPGACTYCFVGSTLSEVTDALFLGFKNKTVLIVTIIASVFMLIGMGYIAYFARKEFNKLARAIIENQESFELSNVDINYGHERLTTFERKYKYLIQDPQYN